MPFAAALSTLADTARALDEVCAAALADFAGRPDLVLLFFSPHHAAAAAELARRTEERLQPRCLLGCTGEAIVGGGREIENAPALSLWLGGWPKQVELEAFHLQLEETADGYNLFGWPDGLLGADAADSLLLILGDPYTFPTDLFLGQMNETHRGVRVVGGMASGTAGPGEARLLLGGDVKEGGAVGVLLRGPVRVRSVVSQGCRPVGQHMVITRAQDNVIQELGGQTPLARLQHLWQELGPRDQNLMRRGLHLGMVINEYQGAFHRGDFLVRNVLGIDQNNGALGVGDLVRVGQTVQFHIRDAASADEDLHEMLKANLAAHDARPQGALLFTCNGRGSRLFEAPDHDAKAVRAETNGVPLAGFFAQGELGPVGGQNFIHGFTASVVVFE